MAKEKSVVGKIVWAGVAILVGGAMLGLGGFGATGLSGSIRSIGTVGEKHIDVRRYANALTQEMRATEQRNGTPLPFARAQEIGLDQAVLQRLVSTRALDHEAAQMGISIGDNALRDQIVEIPGFQGINGAFDREAYTFALERNGMTEAAFETQLREETARTLLQGAMVGGVVMPDSFTNILIDFYGETRNFTWARLSVDDLEADIAQPSAEQLQSYFDTNIAEFTLPETKRITYAALLPDMLLDKVEISEDELRAEYAARAEEFNQPERRLVERLAYLDEAEANQAAAALEVSGTTFDALVEARGLSLADVDLGDVDRLSLDAAGEAIFAADVGDVVGPLPSDLGPALFRINGVLPAQSTSFEDATPQLRNTLAADRATRLVDAQAQNLDDLLAGGATLEDLAAESDMILGTIDWFDGNGEGIGAYTDFAEAARALTDKDFPAITTLDDGGIFAMRLDEELPERPDTLENAADRVRANWENQQVEQQLRIMADGLKPQLTAGTDFAGLGLIAVEESDQPRTGFITGTPPSFVVDIFRMEPGQVEIVDSFGTVLMVRLDKINPASENPDTAAIAGQINEQVNQQLAQSLFNVYAQDALNRAGQQIDPRALQAVHVNIP